jgi:hypothetical protein
VNSNLTTIVILVSLIHVAVLVVMIWIRVRRSEADGTPDKSANITPCAVCGQPSTHLSYDGLDPNEQRDRFTGLSYSTDRAHYQPVCEAHDHNPPPKGPAAEGRLLDV